MVFESLKLCKSERLDEMGQIKVIQVVMQFVTPKNIQWEKQFVNDVIMTILRIYSENSPLVKMTIVSCLWQILNMIIEAHIKDPTNEVTEQTTHHIMRSLIDVLNNKGGETIWSLLLDMNVNS